LISDFCSIPCQAIAANVALTTISAGTFNEFQGRSNSSQVKKDEILLSL